MALQREDQYLRPQQKFMKKLTVVSTALYPAKIWKRFAVDVYFILKHTPLENFFQHINNLHQNTKFTIEKISNGEQAFLETLLKRNNGKVSILV